MKKIPVIDVTDLYHPHQDPGDNFDLILPYALPEIDLKAVILDATDGFRQPHFYQQVGEANQLCLQDDHGPREPGYIPVTQLNYIFGENVPCGVSPLRPMRTPDDRMDDVGRFQEQGIELFLRTLRESADKVEVAIFSSSRVVAAAFNREPDLLREKVRCIHLCAGACSPDFLEWNVALDPCAFVCLLRSSLPIALYPCASAEGPFALHRNNSYWLMQDMAFIRDMAPPLKSYLRYVFEKTCRNDYLRAMDEQVDEAAMENIYRKTHNVWETAVWLGVTGRKLVKRPDGHYRILKAEEVTAADEVLPNGQVPCTVEVAETGLFAWTPTDAPACVSMYDRGDPAENQHALREALGHLYARFRVNE